ncbi:MAG TPA: DUF499 domain-containing protein [Ktedonobacteraceae bacterium]|nr:DUF499 domain-containing protein [Ktedonobacteraceae bacterium]
MLVLTSTPPALPWCAPSRSFIRSIGPNFLQQPAKTDYEERIKRAYPIHPELFDRLYNDWSALERFQRTRGVLRLVARIVQMLWQCNDQSPLILSSALPLNEAAVESELNKYLEDNWMLIIEKDIDGASALPRSIDGANASGIGKIHAGLRVARTIFGGSAPWSALSITA